MNERVFRQQAGGAARPACRPARARAGFTLAEMLVAIAIFMALMSGLLLLFTGSLRTVRSGYQTIDAYEQARGAITVIRNDLTTAFGSTDFADNQNFYGTPIGMTFVGLVRGSDSNSHADLNIGRVTCVIYNHVSGDVFPQALEVNPTTYADAYPYPMLRFVEQGVGDIDALPLRWDESLDPDNPGAITPNEVLDVLYAEARERHGWPEDEDLCQGCEEEYRRALRREIWIRALAGGDAGMGIYFFSPIQWRPDLTEEEIVVVRRAILYRNIKQRLILEEGYDNDTAEREAQKQAWWGNYVLANNIMSTKTPDERRGEDPNQSEEERHRAWYTGVNFFDYDYTYPNSQDDAGQFAGKNRDNPWWNDVRSLNCDPNKDWRPGPVTFDYSKYCNDCGLPEVVSTTFWMMFESPYPGAPDFKRRFCEQVFLPAAYTRQSYD